MSWNSPSSSALGMSSVFSASRMRSEMRAVLIITSTAATRPPSTRGRSRWLTTPWSVAARIWRTSGCLSAHERLLVAREELDHAPDRLPGVDRVHRRENEVAGLTCLQCGPGRLLVAELTDQDDVRILAQNPAESLVERRCVEPDLALRDDAALVLVDDLNRILERDDVVLTGPVDVVDHGPRASSSFPSRSHR